VFFSAIFACSSLTIAHYFGSFSTSPNCCCFEKPVEDRLLVGLRRWRRRRPMLRAIRVRSVHLVRTLPANESMAGRRQPALIFTQPICVLDTTRIIQNTRVAACRTLARGVLLSLSSADVVSKKNAPRCSTQES
jgi:hypothetical protein